MILPNNESWKCIHSSVDEFNDIFCSNGFDCWRFFKWFFGMSHMNERKKKTLLWSSHSNAWIIASKYLFVNHICHRIKNEAHAISLTIEMCRCTLTIEGFCTNKLRQGNRALVISVLRNTEDGRKETMRTRS